MSLLYKQLSIKEGNVYLTTHSTHFYLRLYSVGHMVKDHLDRTIINESNNHVILYLFNSKLCDVLNFSLEQINIATHVVIR